MLSTSLSNVVVYLLISARAAVAALPNTYPHSYSGIPSADYGPVWQDYFEVTDTLPNVTHAISNPLARSFAGNIPVNRDGHPNDTLFFWAFEKSEGSLTVDAGASDDPWIIWLNGGPGASSINGLMTENGPLQVTADYSIVRNDFSWNNLADTFWIDQPVGVGYSTADSTGYVADEDQTGTDFVGFLTNLVAVFPSLATRPLYLTGESYAGRFIPYITKTLFSTSNPPVNLAKISIGDGALGSIAVFEVLPTLTLIETYPQLINFDVDVYNYFKMQEHLCGYDLNLTYPQQGGLFPTLTDPFSTTGDAGLAKDKPSVHRSVLAKRLELQKRFSTSTSNSSIGMSIENRALVIEAEERRQTWKRDLTNRPNGTIDPYYGCFLFDELLDYAVNFSFPWNQGKFDIYFIPDALRPESPSDPSIFLNDDQTRSALHAPTSKDWAAMFNYPFGSLSNDSDVPGTNQFGDPSVEPMAFLSELAANASANNVGIVFFCGNDDAISGHRGTEAVIQNMTFGGTQGFMRKPSTPWYDDDNNFAGIVHQERNVTYALFQGTGHEVPAHAPEAAYVFVREFILGNNSTGYYDGSSDVEIVGGEVAELAGDILPGEGVIYYGHGTTASSAVAPSDTLAAWAAFLATATLTAPGTSLATSTSTDTATTSTHRSGAVGTMDMRYGFITVMAAAAIAMLSFAI